MAHHGTYDFLQCNTRIFLHGLQSIEPSKALFEAVVMGEFFHVVFEGCLGHLSFLVSMAGCLKYPNDVAVDNCGNFLVMDS